MKALDQDLRVRIVGAVARGESKASVAARFEVGYSTVKKLCAQWRDTGTLESRKHRCGRRRALCPEQSERLLALVAADPGQTLAALREALGVRCGLSTIWAELRRRGLRLKKN